MNNRLVIKNLEFESLYSDDSINEKIKKLFLNIKDYTKMDKNSFLQININLNEKEDLAIYFQKEEEDINTSNMYIYENFYCDADKTYLVNNQIDYDTVYIFNEERSEYIKSLKFLVDKERYEILLKNNLSQMLIFKGSLNCKKDFIKYRREGNIIYEENLSENTRGLYRYCENQNKIITKRLDLLSHFFISLNDINFK